MPGRILTDEQMNALEAQGQAKAIKPAQFKQKRVLSEEEMSSLEQSGEAKPLSNAPDVLDIKGIGQSALENFGNSFGGILPHVQAGVERWLTPNPGKSVDKKLEQAGFVIQQPQQNYTDIRDSNIKRIAQESAEHPVAAGLGSLGGAVVGGIAASPLFGAAKSVAAIKAARNLGLSNGLARAAGSVAGAAKGSALLSAISNPGDTEGELHPFQPMERAENAAKGALLGAGIQGAVEAMPALKAALGFVSRKIGAALTNVSDDQVAQYAKRTDQINKLIKQSGGEMTEAADQVRQEAQNAIRNTRQTFSKQIGNALESAPKDPIFDLAPVTQQLEKVRARLNPNLQGDAVAQIDDMLAKLKIEATKGGGKVSIQQLNEITDFLQIRARSAYMQGGQIFQNPKQALQAAKSAAAVSRKALNTLSPEIAEANNKLFYLHTLEDKLNPNLIAPGKPDSALFAAGSGGNPRNQKMLAAIGDVSGYPLLERAKDLAAAKAFGKPSLLPTDTTGKAAARMLAAGGIGHMVAGPLGSVAAGALTSPATLKLGINAVNLFNKGPSLVAFAQKNPMLAQMLAQKITAPAGNFQPGDPILNDPHILGLFEQNPQLIDNIKNPKLRQALIERINRKPAGP